MSGTAAWPPGLLPPNKITQVFHHDCVGIKMNINQAASYFYLLLKKVLKYFCRLLRVPWVASIVSGVPPI